MRHPVQCLNTEDVLHVITLCAAEGYQFYVSGLLVTFWE